MRSVTNFTIFRDTTKTAKAINNTELNDLFHQDDHLKLSYLQLWKDSLDDPLQMLPMSGKLIQTMPMQGCKNDRPDYHFDFDHDFDLDLDKN